MDISSNPLAVLTFISAPAVLTNASCVLLFGTGNRYGRAVDRTHELTNLVFQKAALDPAETKLRIRQLNSAERRTLLIVRALTCFYTAVASFVASTLVSLIGVVLVSTHTTVGVYFTFGLAFLAGSLGAIAIMTGASMLAVETRFSFAILREENALTTKHVHDRDTQLNQTSHPE